MRKLPLTAFVFLAASTICATASASYEDGLEQLKNKNYVAALREFKDSARAGDPRATYQLGKLYLTGLGVKKDTSKAVEFFETAFNTYQSQLDKLQQSAAENSAANRRTAELQSRIGQRVCRNGILSYVYQPMACSGGNCSYMNRRFNETAKDGQVIGNIEQMSQDGSRMQIRIMGWASNSIVAQKETMNLLENPVLDREIEASKGQVIWDDSIKWFTCD